MNRPRDSQRQRFYRADRALDLYGGPGDFAATQAFVKKVWRSPWSRRRFPRALGRVPTVADGRGTRIARGGQFYINLPRWVRHFLGREAGKVLRESYRAHRVRFRPKRQLTPEALARLRERMQHVRQTAAEKGGD